MYLLSSYLETEHGYSSLQLSYSTRTESGLGSRADSGMYPKKVPVVLCTQERWGSAFEKVRLSWIVPQHIPFVQLLISLCAYIDA